MRSTSRFVSSSSTLVALLLVGWLLPSPAAVAAPQTPAPPTPAVDDLARQVESLKQELSKAQARISELEAELQSLKSGTPNPATVAPANPNGQADAGDPAPVESDEKTRVASVGDFLTKAQAEYATAFPPPSPDDRPEPAAARQRSLERFVASMNRGWRQEVRWSVKINKAERLGEGVLLTVQPLNDDGSFRGDPVPMLVEARRVRRLEVVFQKAQPNETFSVRAVFSPRLSVDMARQEPGLFNNPPLVGPGVEFRYDLAVQGIAKAKPLSEKEAAQSDGRKAEPQPADSGTGNTPATPSR
ncbi:MAG: hypothetical protein JNL80_08270 [Phycisphaerae bacterium]|nr:hypothetical protein [Phycisphaerae bacterium]